MRCMHPVTVKVEPDKLVAGERATQFVPCGKCNYCQEARRGMWSFRLRQELKISSSSHFLTLTYNDDNLPISETGGLPTLVKQHLQLFTKRLRKVQESYSSERLRYYSVGEYGTHGERPHYHSIMYNMRSEVVDRLCNVWGLGHVYVGTVEDASIHYVCKYHVNKIGDYGDRAPPFALMSRRPGLGVNYLDTHTKWHLDGLRGYTQVNGFKAALPRYYRDKIFKDVNGEWLIDPVLLRPDKGEVEQYFQEIQRLEKFQENAHDYYAERFRYNHDAIKHKSNLNNKL